MGMGTSKSAPDTPDLNTSINAQTGGNIGMAAVQPNLYDTKSYLGTSKWKETGSEKYTDPVTGETYKVPTYQEKIKLSDEEQAKYDLSSQAQIAGQAQAGAEDADLDEIATRDAVAETMLGHGSFPVLGDKSTQAHSTVSQPMLPQDLRQKPHSWQARATGVETGKRTNGDGARSTAAMPLAEGLVGGNASLGMHTFMFLPEPVSVGQTVPRPR